MPSKFKLMARLVEAREIASFEVADGEDVAARVIEEVRKAHEDGRLGRLAARVGLPSISLQQVGEGQSLGGGEEIVSVALFASDGTPLENREYRVEPSGQHHILNVSSDGGESFEPFGVFPSEEVASVIGQFWKNGHLD